MAVADPLIDEAMAADRFDLADSLAEVVYRACLGSAGRSFRVEALRRRREVQQLRERWDAVVKARAVLASGPDDEAANTTVGHWYGFARRDWETAFPHLTKGSDSDLKTLAMRELNEPPSDPASQMELADAWWDVAEARERESKPALLQRAAFWYQQAKPGLDSPVSAARVTKRLDELVRVEDETTETRAQASERTAPADRRATRRPQPPDIGIEEPEKVPVGKVREYSFGAHMNQMATPADGRTFGAVGFSGYFTYWNTASGEVILNKRLGQILYGVAIAPDGSFAVCGGRDPALYVFELPEGEVIKTIPVTNWQFEQQISLDGKRLLVGARDGVRLWDIERGVQLVRFQEPQGWREGVSFSGDEQLVGTANFDRTAQVFHIPSGREVARFVGHTSYARSIVLSRDGRLALSGGDDNMARLWHIATGREIHRIEHKSEVYGVAFTADGRYTISTGGDLQVWDIANGRQVARFEDAGNRLLLLPDNRFLVTARVGTAFLWRLPLTATGQAFEGEHETPP